MPISPRHSKLSEHSRWKDKEERSKDEEERITESECQLKRIERNCATQAPRWNTMSRRREQKLQVDAESRDCSVNCFSVNLFVMTKPLAKHFPEISGSKFILKAWTAIDVRLTKTRAPKLHCNWDFNQGQKSLHCKCTFQLSHLILLQLHRLISNSNRIHQPWDLFVC
jgi:hypothetical protein